MGEKIPANVLINDVGKASRGDDLSGSLLININTKFRFDINETVHWLPNQLNLTSSTDQSGRNRRCMITFLSQC